MFTVGKDKRDPEASIILQGGIGPWQGYIFTSEERAQLVADRMNMWVRAHMELIPQSLSRAEYEEHCHMVNVMPFSDEECDSYGVKHGNFTPFVHSTKTRVQYALAKRRLNGIKAEGLHVVVVEQAPLTKCDCGHKVLPALVMSTSRGTSCPDCYDRMEGAL